MSSDPLYLFPSDFDVSMYIDGLALMRYICHYSSLMDINNDKTHEEQPYWFHIKIKLDDLPTERKIAYLNIIEAIENSLDSYQIRNIYFSPYDEDMIPLLITDKVKPYNSEFWNKYPSPNPKEKQISLDKSINYTFIPKYIIDLDIAREIEKEDIKKVKNIISKRNESTLRIFRPMEDTDNDGTFFPSTIYDRIKDTDNDGKLFRGTFLEHKKGTNSYSNKSFNEGILRLYPQRFINTVPNEDPSHKILSQETYEENTGKLTITTINTKDDLEEPLITRETYEENSEMLKIITTEQIDQEPKTKPNKKNKEKSKVEKKSFHSQEDLDNFIITHNLQKMMILVIDINLTNSQIESLDYPNAEKYMTTAANGILTVLKKELERVNHKKIEYAVIISSSELGLVYSQGEDKLSKKVYCTNPATNLFPFRSPLIFKFNKKTKNKTSTTINMVRRIKGRVYEE